jgi:hypothetical protein
LHQLPTITINTTASQQSLKSFFPKVTLSALQESQFQKLGCHNNKMILKMAVWKSERERDAIESFKPQFDV